MLQYPRLHLFGRFSTLPNHDGAGGPAWCPGTAAHFALRNVHGAAARGLGDATHARRLSRAVFELDGDARLTRDDTELTLELPGSTLRLDGRTLLRLAGGRARLTDFHLDRVAAERAACGRFQFDLAVHEWDADELPGLAADGRVALTLVLDAYEESERNPSHRTGRLALSVGPPVPAAEVRRLEPVGGAAVAPAAGRVHPDGSVSLDLATALRLQYEGGPLDDFDEVVVGLLTEDGRRIDLTEPLWIDGETYAAAADVLWVAQPGEADLRSGRLSVRLASDGTQLLVEG